ncbi:AraC family transcriptional regulator [Solicola sp. PLA-1-18]|uniref:AraC family transcriptional regulator n=1 Tax=Solicola sp. PLA-1-18 TaxID=3380532 RepID=UPI003B765D38
MSVIRSAGIRGFRQVVTELGGDADAMARRAGLDPAALDADDLLVPEAAMAEVLEVAARTLDRPDLGLLVASRQDLSMLGPLALAIQNSPTVSGAMECTSRYLFVHAPSLSVTEEPDPDGVRGVSALRYGLPPGLQAPVQGTDLGLGFLHRAIGLLVGGSYGLRTVDLPHEPLAPIEVYEEFFGARVRTRRPAALLRLPSSLGDRPLAGSDEVIRQMALGFLAEHASPDDTGVAPQVRQAVQQTLGTTPPDVGAVAALLAVHPRTLQRRLAAEGTSFAEILDDVRRQAARRYLTTTDVPLSQVAGLLGLSEQSALTRCCRRWWDTTPSDVRRGAEV